MKNIYILFICVINSLLISAQNNDSIQKANDKKPVRDSWSCNVLIDNQTTLSQSKGTLEFTIHHRFTGFGNGRMDLFGLYGSSNIRLGFNYGLTKNIMLGFGTEKDNKYQEFLLKVKLIDQNRRGSIPVSVSFFGNACIDAKETSYWGADYKAIDRLSYFAEVLVSRKFTDALSFEVGGSYSHFNKVEGIKNPISEYNKSLYHNDAFGLSLGGRMKIVKEIAFIAEYNQGFYTDIVGIDQLEPKPDLAFGFEKSTPTHTFQLFASTFRGIVPQQNFVKNQYDLNFISQFMLGFNITIRFY
jgi:hypothetical protein